MPVFADDLRFYGKGAYIQSPRQLHREKQTGQVQILAKPGLTRPDAIFRIFLV